MIHEIERIKNLGYINKKKNRCFTITNKYTINSGENIYSFFTLEVYLII